MGSYPGATLSNVTFIGDENAVRWTALADGDLLKTLSGVVVLNKDMSVSRCKLSAPALNGWFLNSMGNLIRHRVFMARVNMADAYGDCQDGVAKVYVPYTLLSGFWGVPVPGGIAVFDASGMNIYPSSEAAKLSGPVYPESLAKLQQESLSTAQGFVDWFIRRFGFEPTSGEDDPNNDNNGQFNLRRFESFEHDYVTPLTAVGSSKSFVGQSMVEATSVRLGSYNRLTFVRFDSPYIGSRQIADKIKNRFSSWQWVTLTIQEAVPSSDGDWVIYVGQPTQLNYVVSRKPDGAMTAKVIADLEGKQEKPADVPVAEPSSVVISADSKLEEMSSAEFNAVFEAVLKEWVRRQTK